MDANRRVLDTGTCCSTQVAATMLEYNRTVDECTAYWKAAFPNRRGAWSAREDELLRTMVERNGVGRWNATAAHIPGRSAKQCRERWVNNLDPAVRKGPWTASEDDVLIRAQSELGNKWSQISKLLPGRPDNAVKNRWYCLRHRLHKHRGSGGASGAGGGGGGRRGRRRGRQSAPQHPTQPQQRASLGSSASDDAVPWFSTPSHHDAPPLATAGSVSSAGSSLPGPRPPVLGTGSSNPTPAQTVQLSDPPRAVVARLSPDQPPGAHTLKSPSVLHPNSAYAWAWMDTSRRDVAMENRVDGDRQRRLRLRARPALSPSPHGSSTTPGMVAPARRRRRARTGPSGTTPQALRDVDVAALTAALAAMSPAAGASTPSLASHGTAPPPPLPLRSYSGGARTACSNSTPSSVRALLSMALESPIANGFGGGHSTTTTPLSAAMTPASWRTPSTPTPAATAGAGVDGGVGVGLALGLEPLTPASWGGTPQRTPAAEGATSPAELVLRPAPPPSDPCVQQPGAVPSSAPPATSAAELSPPGPPASPASPGAHTSVTVSTAAPWVVARAAAPPCTIQLGPPRGSSAHELGFARPSFPSASLDTVPQSHTQSQRQAHTQSQRQAQGQAQRQAHSQAPQVTPHVEDMVAAAAAWNHEVYRPPGYGVRRRATLPSPSQPATAVKVAGVAMAVPPRPGRRAGLAHPRRTSPSQSIGGLSSHHPSHPPSKPPGIDFIMPLHARACSPLKPTPWGSQRRGRGGNTISPRVDAGVGTTVRVGDVISTPTYPPPPPPPPPLPLLPRAEPSYTPGSITPTLALDSPWGVSNDATNQGVSHAASSNVWNEATQNDRSVVL